MSISSHQDPYSIDLTSIVSNDTITIKLDDVNPSVYSYDSMLAGDQWYRSLPDTITISNHNQYELDFGEEWRTHFPDFHTVENMCKEYPALEKALENFKTIYKMVKDDYDNKTKDKNT